MAVTSMINNPPVFTKNYKENFKMLYDKENLFSENQAITDDAASTNVIDFSKGTLKEIAFGTPIPLRIQVTENFATLTSLNIQVQTATDAAFTTPVTLAETGAIATATLKAGYTAPIRFIPKGNLGYMRLYYDVTGSNATTGKITAGIVAANEGSYQDM